MWPFSRKKKDKPKKGRLMQKIVVGVVIGGAIGSIVGKKLLDKHRAHHEDDEGAEDAKE